MDLKTQTDPELAPSLLNGMIKSDELIIFAVLSILIILISRRNLLKIRSHGFYRFLNWECIAWLIAVNYKYWIVDPFGIPQILSWILLILSGAAVIAGILKLKKAGGARDSREDDELYSFEKTTELVDTGIYRYIRHPLYASLLYLTWGIFLKHPTVALLIVSALSSVFLYVTARYDEKECIGYFGDKYEKYMNRSKRFVPFIF